MVSTLSQAGTLESLDTFRWDRRVLLVYVVTDERRRALDTLGRETPGLDDRDVTWFVLDDDELVGTNHDTPVAAELTQKLREGFAPIGRPIDVMLIGKDGGLKRRASTLDIRSLFELIDGMPMRRRELEAKSADPAGSAP